MHISLRLCFAVVMTGVLVHTGSVGCGKRVKKGPGKAECEKRGKRTKAHFAQLCRAWDGALHEPTAAVGSLKLAHVDLPTLNSLPKAPLVVVGRAKLVVQGKTSRSWQQAWPLDEPFPIHWAPGPAQARGEG